MFLDLANIAQNSNIPQVIKDYQTHVCVTWAKVNVHTHSWWHQQDATWFADIPGRAQPKAISMIGCWSTCYMQRCWKHWGSSNCGVRKLKRCLLSSTAWKEIMEKKPSSSCRNIMKGCGTAITKTWGKKKKSSPGERFSMEISNQWVCGLSTLSPSPEQLDLHLVLILFQVGGWTEWPPQVPSSLSHSLHLWFTRIQHTLHYFRLRLYPNAEV